MDQDTASILHFMITSNPSYFVMSMTDFVDMALKGLLGENFSLKTALEKREFGKYMGIPILTFSNNIIESGKIFLLHMPQRVGKFKLQNIKLVQNNDGAKKLAHSFIF